MKKVFLLSITVALGVGAFAQSAPVTTPPIVPLAHTYNASKAVGRTTGHYDDSIGLFNGINVATDSIYIFPVGSTSLDSGFVLGEGMYGFTSFGQRCDFKGADSSIQVLGLLYFLAGSVNPSSTNNVIFKVWSMGSPVVSGTHTYSGFPNAVLDSVIVPCTGKVTTAIDSYAASFFPTPTSYLTSSFFVGCTINYTWGTANGDTVGLVGSDFSLEPEIDSIHSGDTTINDQSVAYNSGTWYDNEFDLGYSSPIVYWIFPIVNSHVTTGVNGVTKNNLTFYGNYPNPATDNTNVKFSLANNTDVTIVIMNMTGQTINTINEKGLAAGMNIIPVNTSALPSGDYLYLVRTAEGGGVAGKMTVVR